MGLTIQIRKSLFEGRIFGVSNLTVLRLEGRPTTHVLPARLGPAAAFGRAGADQVMLHVGQAAKHGKHQ
jgi:hypothetical protein